MILYLSKFLGFNLIITQLDDLTLILLELINYTLLFYLIPFTAIKLFLYFAPAFYKIERLIFFKLISIYLLGTFFSFLVAFFSFYFFYVFYSVQLFNLNFITSTQILVDLKKIIFFLFIFLKYNLFIFLPINLVFLFFIFSIQDPFSFKKDLRLLNLFLFFFLYLIGFLPVDNYVQLFIYYISQTFLLEILILLEFFILQKTLREI